MKLKLTFALFAAYALCGCTTAQRIGDGEDAWIAETSNFFYLVYGTRYYYCRVHKSEDGINVEPMCYKATKYESMSDAKLPLDFAPKKK